MTTNSKHLTYEDRCGIETDLNNNISIYQIANKLNKSHSTILRELKKNKTYKEASTYGGTKNPCKNRHKCSKKYCDFTQDCFEKDVCQRLLTNPYVCNGCTSRNGCRKDRYTYYAKDADNNYRKRLVESRNGFDITQEEIYEINNIIGPLIIDKKQPINHILINHPQIIDFTKPTFYTYINAGLFNFRNIDLNRQVRYKERKDSKKRKTKEERLVRKNRTYQDFLDYIEKHPNCNIVEMDCVEGTKGGKVFLTLLWRKHNFMLIFLLEHQTQECVREIFDYLQQTIFEDVYNKLFEVILTDNGSEFLDSFSVEHNHKTKIKVTNLFYCDPGASYQKGSLEKNHEFIRYVLPKGTSFDNLTQDDCSILANHINSLCRESLNNNCPFKSMLFTTNEELLNKLSMYYIEPDMVTLNNTLLKK